LEPERKSGAEVGQEWARDDPSYSELLRIAKAVDEARRETPHPSRDRAVFAPHPRSWHGAEMAKSRGRTSGCVARRGPRLPRRNCATTF